MSQLEQEIKLQVASSTELDLSGLSWLAGYQPADAKTEHLVSTYFDTESMQLVKSGAGLRLRRMGDQWFQTVKSTGQVVDGLHQRQEWEHKLTQPEFDLALLQQTALAPLIADNALWQQVKPVFTTDFVRHSWQLTLPEQTQVELAYDFGKAYSGEYVQPIHEIELELKAGSVEQMKQLAQQFLQSLPVQFSSVSKAQQGYRLFKQNKI